MDKKDLILAVSAFFETESHKLSIDEIGNPIFHPDVYHRMNQAMSIFNFPNDIPKYSYDILDSEFLKYFSTLSENYHFIVSPLVEIRSDLIDHWIDHLYELNFSLFYPHITIALTHLKQLPEKPDFLKMKFLVEHLGDMKNLLSPTGRYAVKAWINYYYGMQKDEIPKNQHDIRNYYYKIKMASRYVIDEVKESLNDFYIAADTDEIFFSRMPKIEQDVFNEIVWGFPIEIKEHTGGIFFSKKKHIIVNKDQNVNLRGINRATFH